MSNQLLPCPCCGGKPMEMQYDGTLWVQCEDCALNTAACDASADYVQLWNRRATQPATGKPKQQTAINADDLPTKKYPLGALDFDAPVAAGEPVAWQMIHRHHPNPSWQNCPKELFDQYEAYHKQYGGESPVRALVVAAPPAAAPVPACEPAGKIVAFGESLHEVSWRKGKLPPLGTELFANAPPAAAHGDEAVQYRLLRVGEIIQATDELLRDNCTTWQPMSDGPQLGIGWGWHAGLMPVRRIDAAMRAQGDGEVQ